jgi:opacity protein-like surface antigen
MEVTVTRFPLAIIAIVFVAAVCCVAPALAQEPAAPAQDKNSSGGHGFGVQVLGGPLFSNYDDVTGLNFDQRIGYLIGMAFGGNRRGVVGIQGDVLYGSKPVEIVGKGTLEQSVVHVPVMLKVNLGQASAHGFRAFLLGGGYIEWQFNGKLQNVNLADDTSGFEAGFTVGGGFEVLRLGIQARWVRGLRGIDKTFNLGQTVEMKSNCFLLLFGLRLN